MTLCAYAIPDTPTYLTLVPNPPSVGKWPNEASDIASLICRPISSLFRGANSQAPRIKHPFATALIAIPTGVLVPRGDASTDAVSDIYLQ
jgi:hypothetical protein